MVIPESSASRICRCSQYVTATDCGFPRNGVSTSDIAFAVAVSIVAGGINRGHSVMIDVAIGLPVLVQSVCRYKWV